MRYKGLKFRRVHHITWRYSKEGEKSPRGAKLGNAQCVFVRVKDCLDARSGTNE